MAGVVVQVIGKFRAASELFKVVSDKGAFSHVKKFSDKIRITPHTNVATSRYEIRCMAVPSPGQMK